MYAGWLAGWLVDLCWGFGELEGLGLDYKDAESTRRMLSIPQLPGCRCYSNRAETGTTTGTALTPPPGPPHPPTAEPPVPQSRREVRREKARVLSKNKRRKRRRGGGGRREGGTTFRKGVVRFLLKVKNREVNLLETVERGRNKRGGAGRDSGREGSSGKERWRKPAEEKRRRVKASATSAQSTSSS